MTQPTAQYNSSFHRTSHINKPEAPPAVTQVFIIPQEVITIGNCPVCMTGMLEDDFSCLGVFCAVFFFPLGVLYYLGMKNKICNACGATF